MWVFTNRIMGKIFYSTTLKALAWKGLRDQNTWFWEILGLKIKSKGWTLSLGYKALDFFFDTCSILL